MPNPDAPSVTPVDARASVMRLVLGGFAAHVVGTAVNLDIADAVGAGGAEAADLARQHAIPRQRMVRLLRALAALGVCTETAPGRFALTEVGNLLRRDQPGSVREFVLMFTDPVMMGAWPRLESAIRTGETQFDEVFGAAFFDHLAGQPELSALFNASMSQGTRAVAAAVPERYDFSRYASVVDVGGGDGTLLTAILKHHAAVRGTVFDTAEGAAQATDTIRAAEVADRCDVAHGNFFDAVPAGAEVYLLKSVVHDWDDERAGVVLRHCRAAVPAHGRLLIIEPVLPDVVPPDASAGIYLTDLNMLVNVGGRERTRPEFEELCAAAGFAVTDVVALPETGFALIEAVPAPG